MTTHGNGKALVILNVLPALEERVVDWLLARRGGGFTSFPVSGHSTRHEGLSAAEQVTGQQRRQQFNVLINAGEVERFLAEFRRSLGAADVRYWVLPVAQSGTFGDDDSSDGGSRDAD
jgi:hypothetical protein